MELYETIQVLTTIRRKGVVVGKKWVKKVTRVDEKILKSISTGFRKLSQNEKEIYRS